jgi:copper(I)-binding protein
MRLRLIFAVLLALLPAACGPGGGASSATAPSVSDAWVRAAAAGGQSAAYFTLSNPTESADALISATSQAAGKAEVRQG